jgi:hypothetical protein
MFGIEDSCVSAAYLLCILSSLLCVLYGLATWNRGDEPTSAEDVRWAQEEKHVEDEL